MCTRISRITPLVVVIGLAAGCVRSSEAPPTASSLVRAHGSHAIVSNGALTPQQKQGVADVRNATVKFHDFAYTTSANGGGYTEQYPAGCASSSTGAQDGAHAAPGP